MLKHAKGLILLLIVGAALAGYIVFFERGEVKTGKSTNIVNKPSDYFSKLDRLEIAADGFKVVFEKHDDKWFLVSPVKYPADKSRVRNILDEIDLAVPDRTIKADEVDAKRLKSYELDKPRFTVNMRKKGEDPITVEFGCKAPYPADYIYARVKGEGDVHVVPGSIYDYLSKKVEDYRNRKPFDLSALDTAKLSLQGIWNYTIEHEADHWKLTSPFTAAVGTLDAENLCGDVYALDVSDFVDDKPSSFASYGLDKPAGVIVAVDDEGREYRLLVGSKVDPNLTPGVEQAARYARTADRPNVFTVLERKLNKITADPLELVDAKLCDLAYEDFERMDLTAPTGSVSIAMKEEDLKFLDEKGEPAGDADGDAVDELIKKLNKITAEEVELIEDEKALGFDGSFVIEINPGKVGPKAHLKLELGRTEKDTGLRYVRRNGEGVALLVKADSLAFLDGLDRFSFLDRRMNRFEADDAVFVALRTEDKALSFTKRKGEWVCDTRPDAPVDEKKLKEALESWEDFKASATFRYDEAKKAIYGFDSPRAKLTVRCEKKEGDKTVTKTVTIVFGKNSAVEDKPGVYAWIEGEEFAFIAPDSVFQKLYEKFLGETPASAGPSPSPSPSVTPPPPSERGG